jgi:flagellar biosynthesis protein
MDETKNTPIPEAVAIRYDKGREDAPRVVAKGRGFVAQQLLAIAKHHSVPVYQNQTVTQLLMAVELDREIPPELYQAVASVLAFVYRMDGRAAELAGKRR